MPHEEALYEERFKLGLVDKPLAPHPPVAVRCHDGVVAVLVHLEHKRDWDSQSHGNRTAERFLVRTLTFQVISSGKDQAQDV